MMKFKDLKSVFVKGQTKTLRPNKSNGRHFCSISWRTTSSDAVLSYFTENGKCVATHWLAEVCVPWVPSIF